jgi:hypothetical protein
MVKKITVQGIRRREPDVKSFVLALLELARMDTEPGPDNSPPTELPPSECRTS